MPQQQKFVSKQSYKYRWLVMSFAVWIVLGAYFCYDIPASLHNTLKDHMDSKLNYQILDIDGDVFEIYFSGLYSIYAFANIFLPFISGGFRDVMGDRFVVIMLGVLVVFGQTVFTYGVMQKSFVIMYVGRVFLGWGIESMLPTLTSFISPYYKEDYLVYFYITKNLIKGILSRYEPVIRTHWTSIMHVSMSHHCRNQGIDRGKFDRNFFECGNILFRSHCITI